MYAKKEKIFFTLYALIDYFVVVAAEFSAGEGEHGRVSGISPLKSQPDGMVFGSGNGSKIGAWTSSTFSFGGFMVISP
ncbi:MAG: hypothetical protein A2X25_03015 [Chloroflexi bacterium GWB2_49_20]|nr:MAG: hypothetical protein A2X25_03015 [Chloroflexi bacterium GWB2_49_20]OGN76069.1 MAG: hypothetical protein A2X26_11285 [Chloroflexi bacterium GWC2_49_37]OGN83455.1 MAG: hypothetical protein A2X27_09120 [Chloroflexi bacterium GWD2_49_16]HBG73853.1 hypothetical protein [Anaerolineae bacterium]HCC79568.1 hypothetical protein [Anaerolineae bacterium]